MSQAQPEEAPAIVREESPAVPETAPPAATPKQDDSARAAALADELAEIRAAAVAGATVTLHLDPEGPHSAFTVGHTTVTKDPTPVPAAVVDSLLTAAAEAGVRLITTEE